MVELTGCDGTVRLHEVSTGGTNTADCSAATVGLLPADGKRTLACTDEGMLPPAAAVVRIRSGGLVFRRADLTPYRLQKTTPSK